jgi:uncharacterized membrane protein YcaP (DUF421 family)
MGRTERPVVFSLHHVDCCIATARVAVGGLTGYVALVDVLRIAGARTLARLNAFDLMVTVALGSILASAVLAQKSPSCPPCSR